MSLTLSTGPLATRRPSQVNYAIDGPKRLLHLSDFPRRVRARLGDAWVLDSRQGRLLHETGLLPVLYVPEGDVADDLLEATDHRTHCPYKGDAAYWSVRTGDRVAENAVWAYPEPLDEVAWLRGLRAVRWEAMDAWYDEEEQVYGHLRDPFHRVDVRDASGTLRVRVAGDLVAESDRAKVLSENGMPNRYYLPREDVRVDLRRSEKTAVCPYKGTSTYWSTEAVDDVAWSYEDPLPDTARIAGHVSFDDGSGAVTVERR